MFTNTMPRYDILSDDAMAVFDFGWRRLISEIGIEFLDDDACELFRKAGQTVEGQVVKFDPDFVLEQLKTVPTEFTLQARNPEKNVAFAPNSMVFCSTQSTPFVRDGLTRREGTFNDYEQLVKLSHVFDEIDTAGYPVVEPGDREIESRHLDMLMSLYTLSDKPMGCAQFRPNAAADTIAMADIVYGRESIEQHPAMFGIINANSPLRFDTQMIGSLFELARANQICVVTPFILMGAMGPVSTPAALVQQTAEVLAGIVLTQLVRPGAPVIMGSFVSHTDMQSGSPGFGGPESFQGLLASGQIARHFGLLWRAGGGGLTASQTVDAQAAFEALNTMMPSFLAGANLQLHAVGWLESGLVTCYEKYVTDLEMLRILIAEFRPLEITPESLAFGAHAEVGHGGHFFGAAHTLERFRECFYRPLVFSTENYDRWTRKGSLSTTARASERWRELLASYEAPAQLDDDVLGRLSEFVEKRRAEYGD